MTDRKSPQRLSIAAALLLIPTLVTVMRSQDTGVADALNAGVTLAGITGPQHEHVQQILFVPLSAVVVALFRLTLGFRVLGLFRPILLALAFHATGIGPGLAFLALALAVITAVHPLLHGTHSFSRLVIVLTLVSTLLLVGGLVETQFVSFPVVALCLTCETFATKLRYRGAAEALARTMATVLPALVIAAVAAVPGFFDWLLRHPEMLVAEVGAVLVIDGWLNLRLLTAAGHHVPWAPLRLIATAADAGSTD